MAKTVKIAKSVKKLIQDDPRRITHSVKVGLAITLVSLFYYSQLLYHNLGSSALWAILTVIVVFEFHVGATLCKGLNRALATIVAGALGVGVHSLASNCGNVGEPLLIGILVFLQAVVATFMRFFPKIKARYDYGFLIFTLTFAFVSISGFRVHEIVELARKRGATIVIGVVGSFLFSVFFFPAWAGEDLHNLVANNLDKIGISLEGFGVAYFKLKDTEVDQKCETVELLTYKSVLHTKNNEENLANFARWEPRHGRFKFRHPWTLYLKLGTLTRECAYKIDALNSYLNPDIAATVEFKGIIREECNKMSSEASKALKELAKSLKNMSKPSTCEAHITKSKEGVKRLKDLLKSSTLLQDCGLLQVIPAATVASILIDIVNCTEKIAACATELSSLAEFETSKKETLQSQSKNANQETKKMESVEGTRSGNQDQSRPFVDTFHVAITIDAAE